MYRLLSALPLSVLYRLGGLFYLLTYYVLRYRRRVVEQNLLAAFPELTPLQRKNLGRAYYRQLCDVAVEILKAASMPAEEFLERVNLVNPELLAELKQRDQGAILLTVHQGNWEWMLHAVAMASGMPIDAVYKPLHNRRVDEFIHVVRSRFGAQPIAMANATREMLRRRRELTLFAMVADQSPTRREKGLWVDFLNQPAAFFLGAEKIALASGRPVLFAAMRRVSRGHYEVRFSTLARPPYTGHEEGAITREYVAAAEAAIRAQPESWLWSNRRWKRSPPEVASRD